MTIEKKVISKLEKCYSIASLTYNGGKYFLVAAEKHAPCYLFDEDGRQVDTIWEEPGGVMNMVQVPGTNGQFLAIQKFYSPNDSKEAEIVVVTPKEKAGWDVRLLVKLPFVHRFDILSRNGEKYLIACTLKSGHTYQDDWSKPGKIYVAKLPENLLIYNRDYQLKLTVLKEGMTKNHGYYRILAEGVECGIISSEEGVFQVTPPKQKDEIWGIEKLISESASDAVLLDLDGDGEMELGVLSPFHGENISIYKKNSGNFEKVYEYNKTAEFAHAIYGGNLCGKPSFIVGYRKGERNILAFTWNAQLKNYHVEILDRNCGAANIYHYMKDGKDILISANREINEVAMYTLI